MNLSDDLPRGVVVERGIDWITGTARQETRRRETEAIGRLLVDLEKVKGNQLTRWRFEGYEGFASGGASWGWREDTTILRLSGACAAANATTCLPVLDNVSRLDLQVTARQETSTPDLGAKALVAVHQAATNRGRYLNTKGVVDNGAVSTVYVGRRTSDRFGRLYDKRLESDDARYQDCWRWEVEYKKGRASFLATRLLQSESPEDDLLRTVHHYWAVRGFRPTWPSEASVSIDTYPAPKTDRDRRLRWLEKQVRPALAWLLEETDRASLRRVLDLDD